MIKQPTLINTNPNIFRFKEFYYIPSQGLMFAKDISRKKIKSIKNHFKVNNVRSKSMVDLEKTYPTEIGINLTNSCNLRCVYCFADSNKDRNEVLSDDKIDVIIKMLIRNAKIREMASLDKTMPPISIILSGGGEPTFDFDKFKRFISKVRKHENIFIHLITNGIFTEEKALYIIENINSVNFSFDGTPMLQNAQRPTANGSESFDIIYRSIKLFDKYEKPYSIRTTVSQDNYKYLNEMCEYIFSNFTSIQGWLLESIFEGGRANKLAIDNKSNFSSYFDRICEYVNEHYPDKSVMNTEFTYMLKDNFCSASNGSNFWVDAFGDVVECNSLENKNVFQIGHVSENDVVLTGSDSSDYNNYLERMLKMCENCFVFNICSGGCPDKMIRNEKGKFIDKYKQAKCNYIKEYWKNKLNNVYKNKETSDIKLDLFNNLEGVDLYKIKLRGNK